MPGQNANVKRASLAWLLVALAGVAVVASFFLRSDEAPADKAGGGPKVTTVSAAKVTRGALTERGRYPGELVADAADVAAFYTGRLVSIGVRVGDKVEKGAVLAELDPVDARQQIAQARAQAKAAAAEEQRAQVERDAALREAARLEPLAKDKLISELEIDKQRARAAALTATVEAAAASEAEARARVDLLERRVIESRVRAPFAGRIAQRFVDPGAIVQAGAKLVRLVAESPLHVRFDVPEQDVPSMRVGTAVQVITKAGGDNTTAAVTGVGSEVDRERRVATAEALIATPPAGWLPGMYAEAVVDRRTIPDALRVPAEAVLQRLQPSGQVATGVFVEQGGAAKWVPVNVVARDGNVVAVDGAVTDGASVLVGGHVDLMDGSKIRVAGADGAGK
jgi:HlyD family secretion protein